MESRNFPVFAFLVAFNTITASKRAAREDRFVPD
jgi:hypothetical protein